jgi:uncharacterized OB-fold protein
MTDEKKTFEHDPFVAAFPETRAFWTAAAEGRLMLPVCEDCGRAHWYPRALCPLCGSEKLRWTPASGRGTVHAFSPARRAEPQYVLAYVTLDEGPTLMTNLVGAPIDAWSIGQAVQVRFQPSTEGRMMPFFEPVAG